MPRMTLRASLLSVVLAVALLGCGPAPGQDGEVVSEVAGATAVSEPVDSSVVAVPTCEDFCGEDALAYGVLASDGEACVWFEGEEPVIAQNVVWPRGFAARFTEAGVELLSPNGEVVAREGDILEMGGGGYVEEEPSCAPGEDSVVWRARSVTVVEELPDWATEEEDVSGDEPATVVADQPVLPTSGDYEHIGVATDPSELHLQWQRFGLADVPPVTDMDRRVLLFAGFGESGSCPYVFNGIAVDGQTVIFLNGQPEQDCTDDYNPRTVVVSIDEDELPAGFVTVDLPADAADVVISISGSEQPPAVADSRNETDADVALTVAPQEVAFGGQADVSIRNGTEGVVSASPVVTIERWTGRHFETIGALTGGDDVTEVGPGAEQPLLTLSTTDPQFPTADPGWFRLTVQNAAEGIDVHGHVHIIPAETGVTGTHAITSGPPCDRDASCASVLLIDGVEYSPSCGLVNPAVVTEEVYATGEGHTVHVIDGVDPRVMVAWDHEHCEPLEGRWRVMFAVDQRGSAAEQNAWCRASLNGADPAEGFTC